MMLFPQGPISLGRMANATLRDVVKDKTGVIARYTLTPSNTVDYIDRMGGLRAWLGHRYAPLPGTWASFVVPSDRDEVDLLIGLDRNYGKSLVRAHEALRFGGTKTSVVPDLTVRTLALGYLARAGV